VNFWDNFWIPGLGNLIDTSSGSIPQDLVSKKVIVILLGRIVTGIFSCLTPTFKCPVWIPLELFLPQMSWEGLILCGGKVLQMPIFQ